MNKEERKRLVHLGRLDEKRKLDSFVINEARKWVLEAACVGNIISDQTVTWTDDERLKLREVEFMLREKQNELREFSENHYGKLMEAVHGTEDERASPPPQ